MKTIKLTTIGLALAVLLTGCGQTADDGTDASTTTTATGTTSTTLVANDDEMFTDRDLSVAYDSDTAVTVKLNDSSVSCSSDAVRISGTTVTVLTEGTFVFTGSLTDGKILVNAGESAKPHLILNGVSITSKSSAALYIYEADKVVVTLADGTSNTLENGGSFTAIDDSNIDGAVFSKQDLTFNGGGSLTVTSPAGHGIVCKDDLVIAGGTYTVNAASHGLDANDSIRISGASLTLDTGKDGIHAENSDDASLGYVYVESGTLGITAEGDGISAGATMQIIGGTFTITAGGGSANASKESSDSWGDFMGGRQPGYRGMSQSVTQTTDSSSDSSSMKGIKSTGNMQITGGTFTIDSADDAVHANASIAVGGGTFTIASGDDGFHADETLTVTAGKITITESYEGLEGQNIKVTGGEISVTADDDGLNAAGGTDSSGTAGGRDGMFGGGMGGPSGGNGSIEISGGTLYIAMSGDGIDSNGTLVISGGEITVCGSTSGDTAVLDYDSTGVITGGTFMGTGAYQMAQTFSGSENQGVIAVSVGSQSAGTAIAITDEKGDTVVSYAPEKAFQIVIYSSPTIVKGENYTISVGSVSGEFEAT